MTRHSERKGNKVSKTVTREEHEAAFAEIRAALPGGDFDGKKLTLDGLRVLLFEEIDALKAENKRVRSLNLHLTVALDKLSNNGYISDSRRVSDFAQKALDEAETMEYALKGEVRGE